MSLVRDLGITLPAMTETLLITCSEALSTAAGSTTAIVNKSRTTADILASPTAGTFTTAFGRVIDRLGAPLGAHYQVALPAGRLTATRGSTEADRQIKLGVYLLHGDSSGGGDMVPYSTYTRQAADRTYFGTGRTTDMANWDATLSSGPADLVTNPSYYDLRAAKRYIQVAVRCLKDKITTESSGDEHGRISATVTLMAGDLVPQTADVKSSPFSTTTST